jgi:hypothetical protein
MNRSFSSAISFSHLARATPAPNLFADVHMRRAFAYALNLTQYFEDYSSHYRESNGPRASWWLRGMKPDYESKTLAPHYTSSTIVEEELKVAGVWEQGFEAKFVDVIARAGSTQIVIAHESEMLAYVMNSLTTS